MQAAPSFSSLVILVIGLMFVAGLGWLVITYFTKHMTEMSEGEREDVNSNANRWALIGVLPSLGLSIALEDVYRLTGKGVILLAAALVILFSLTGHLGALLKRDKSASPALLISSLLLSLLMPVFALPLAGYALSSPKNALTGIALIMAGIMGAIVGLTIYLIS
jgi:hypothetical protein